jgi:hypothetical protein
MAIVRNQELHHYQKNLLKQIPVIIVNISQSLLCREQTYSFCLFLTEKIHYFQKFLFYTLFPGLTSQFDKFHPF